MTFILLFRFNKRNRLKPDFKTSCMIGLVQSNKSYDSPRNSKRSFTGTCSASAMSKSLSSEMEVRTFGASMLLI